MHNLTEKSHLKALMLSAEGTMFKLFMDTMPPGKVFPNPADCFNRKKTHAGGKQYNV